MGSDHQAVDTDETAHVAEQIKEKAWTDNLAALNHVSSPVDEEKHVDSLLTPIRRKSLYTPGIATRNPDDILQKRQATESPSSPVARDYYYNPSKPESSPLSRLAALRLAESQRSGTPADLSYTHLGGLRVGTLRVTNGAASPALSIHDGLGTEPSCFDLRSHDVYYTASEGSYSDDEAYADNEYSRNREAIGRLPVLEPSGSAHSVWNDQPASEPCVKPVTPRPSQTFSDSRFHEPDQAPIMANDYMAELPASPYHESQQAFHDARGSSPIEIERRFHDTDFEDEAVALSDMPDDETGNWTTMKDDSKEPTVDAETQEYALQKLSGTLPQRIQMQPKLWTTSTSVSTTSRDKDSTIILSQGRSYVRTVTQIDSGYSSNGSLQSFVSHSMPPAAHPEPPPPNPTHKERRASIETIAKSRKLRKSRPTARSQSANIVTPQGYRELIQAHIPPVPSAMALRNAERFEKFPVLEHTFPSLQHTRPKTDVLMDDLVPAQIRFPSAENTSDMVSSAEAMPGISTTSQMPWNSQNPRESQSSTWSRGEDERPFDSDICRSPSWSNFGGKRKKEQKRLEKEQKELEKDTKKLQRSRRKSGVFSRRSRSSTPKADRKMSETETLTTIADFGTVTESLGRSPYDIAKSAVVPTRNDGPRITHPHQMSTMSTRPKSMYSRGNFATDNSVPRPQQRGQSLSESHDPNVEASTGRCREQGPKSMHLADGPPCERSRPQGRPRSQSLWQSQNPSGHKIARCETPRDTPRPKSMFVEAPPLPTTTYLDMESGARERVITPRSTSNFSRPRMQQYGSSQTAYRVDDLVNESRNGHQDEPSIPAHLLPEVVDEHVNESRNVHQDEPSVPVRLLPEAVVEREAQISKATLEKWHSTNPPRRASRQAVEEAWWVGSKDECEQPAPAPVDEWEAHRQHWAQRRKSVGEALLQRNNASDDSIFSDAPFQAARNVEEVPSNPPIKPMRSRKTRDGLQTSRDQQPDTRRFSSGSTPASFNIPRKPISASSPLAKRLTGRFEGGLFFNYEPGIGIGGSAGTRNVKSAASRKSVDMSKGFGLDLSDVPVFLASGT